MIFGRKRTEEEELFGQYKDHLVTHAKNEKVHYAGVAGGTVTALLLYALEEGIIDGAIVAGYDENEPWKVKAKIAKTKEDLLTCVRSTSKDRHRGPALPYLCPSYDAAS